MAKILVVDDDAGVSRTIQAMLFGTGHEVTCETNSKLVVDNLSTAVFDLIISDIFMPECDGIELVLKIREVSPETKILIMTGGGRMFPSGSESLGDIIEGAQLFGANTAIMKPFRRQQLVDTVFGLVG